MKPLSEAVQDYLALRRALGFELRHETWFLPSFVAYLEARGMSVITTESALQWAQQPADAHPNWWAKRLGAIRRFAKHHHAFEPRTEVPSSDLLPTSKHRPTPHLYTDEELAALLLQARTLPHPLQAATYATLIALLAITGLRVGEAIALDREDVDERRALLTVRNSKFHKSREVPVHASTLTALKVYARLRDRSRRPRRSPSFFISRAGTRLIYANVQHTFARLVRQAGLTHQPGRPPRIHDLRHSFAVATLRDWYRAGVEVEPRLPWLSTYLGHVNPTTTYWYLTATPELLSLAGERLESALGALP